MCGWCGGENEHDRTSCHACGYSWQVIDVEPALTPIELAAIMTPRRPSLDLKRLFAPADTNVERIERIGLWVEILKEK